MPDLRQMTNEELEKLCDKIEERDDDPIEVATSLFGGDIAPGAVEKQLNEWGEKRCSECGNWFCVDELDGYGQCNDCAAEF